VHNALISRIKILADMDISERRKPQDGQIRRDFEGESLDFRVSTLPTVYGEKCVIRLLKKEAHLADLAQLGFNRDQLRLVQKVSRKPQGLVLVTGPTGSGKTTTLHAILNTINEPDINIVTLEDPVEAAIPGVNHVAIKDKAGMGFAAGLRSILRQDPDVVFVGEMRDSEVAKIAIKAALTGHLVLSTLHTDGVVETFGRLLDMGVDPHLLANSTELVLAQRLLRRVCTKCSRPVALTPELIEEFDLTEQQVATAAAKEPVGCKSCLKTGYKGRVAVYESIAPNRELRKLLREGGDEQAILDHSRELGMITLHQAGIGRALAGETTFDEVRRRLGGAR
jgi:type IV pilus assembly protein PilB